LNLSFLVENQPEALSPSPNTDSRVFFLLNHNISLKEDFMRAIARDLADGFIAWSWNQAICMK
jgi:hypothetical protein